MVISLYRHLNDFEFQYAMVYNQARHYITNGPPSEVRENIIKAFMLPSSNQKVKYIIIEYTLRTQGKWWASKMYYNKDVETLSKKLYDTKAFYSLNLILGNVSNYDVDEEIELMKLKYEL